MSECDELIERVSEELRQPVPTSVVAKARIMNAVRRTRPRHTPASVWHWIARPRPVMVSPLSGLALAASVALVAVLVPRPAELETPARTAEGPVAPAVALAGRESVTERRSTQFVLVAPHASRVSLVGSFNDWDPAATPLRRASDGMWTAVVPLAPGLHMYAFVVDGTDWMPDPTAPRASDDDFGNPSSVAIIGESRT